MKVRILDKVPRGLPGEVAAEKGTKMPAGEGWKMRPLYKEAE